MVGEAKDRSPKMSFLCSFRSIIIFRGTIQNCIIIVSLHIFCTYNLQSLLKRSHIYSSPSTKATRASAGSTLFLGRRRRFNGRRCFGEEICAGSSAFLLDRPSRCRGAVRISACEAAVLDVGTSHPSCPPPPTYLFIFSAVGRYGRSSGLNRASIHRLTCVRAGAACKKDGTLERSPWSRLRRPCPLS